MKTILSSLILVASIALPLKAMTPSELAQFASGYQHKDNETVAYIQQQTGCARPLEVTLVKTFKLRNGRIGGITKLYDCPIAVFTYFEMERNNLDSISVFSQVISGRSTGYANWSPNFDVDGGLTPEELRSVALAINRYAPR